MCAWKVCSANVRPNLSQLSCNPKYSQVFTSKSDSCHQSSLQMADQMAIAAGIPCDVDPLLVNVMKTHCGKSMVSLTLAASWYFCAECTSCGITSCHVAIAKQKTYRLRCLCVPVQQSPLSRSNLPFSLICHIHITWCHYPTLPLWHHSSRRRRHLYSVCVCLHEIIPASKETPAALNGVWAHNQKFSWNLRSGKKTFANISTDCFSHHLDKTKKYKTSILYSHALLRIRIIRGQRSVRIALSVSWVAGCWTYWWGEGKGNPH